MPNWPHFDEKHWSLHGNKNKMVCSWDYHSTWGWFSSKLLNNNSFFCHFLFGRKNNNNNTLPLATILNNEAKCAWEFSFRFLAWQVLIFQVFWQDKFFSLDTRVASHKKLEFGLVLGPPPMLGIRIPPVDGEKNLVFQGDLFVRDIN